MICHGGMGITQKALAHGVPVCVVPFGRDQFEFARRVAVARAGTLLPAKRLTVARLRASLFDEWWADDRSKCSRRSARDRPIVVTSNHPRGRTR